jgi:CubicO group peptidase (beta-lactamase class C family)
VVQVLPYLPALIALGCSTDDVTSARGTLTEAHQGPAPSEGTASPAAARVHEVWQEAAQAGFSGVALVRHQGRVLGHFAAGSRDREQSLPNTHQTAFDIGSITKQLTGAASMRLHEQGRLDLQASLAELFEDVPEDKAGITVHQLLTHTAGFAGALGDDYEPIEQDAYLLRAWDTPLSVVPGTLHWYSNVGYSILGAIIERVTGEAYEAYLQDDAPPSGPCPEPPASAASAQSACIPNVRSARAARRPAGRARSSPAPTITRPRARPSPQSSSWS